MTAAGAVLFGLLAAWAVEIALCIHCALAAARERAPRRRGDPLKRDNHE